MQKMKNFKNAPNSLLSPFLVSSWFIYAYLQYAVGQNFDRFCVWRPFDQKWHLAIFESRAFLHKFALFEKHIFRTMNYFHHWPWTSTGNNSIVRICCRSASYGDSYVCLQHLVENLGRHLTIFRILSFAVWCFLLPVAQDYWRSSCAARSTRRLEK